MNNIKFKNLKNKYIYNTKYRINTNFKIFFTLICATYFSAWLIEKPIEQFNYFATALVLPFLALFGILFTMFNKFSFLESKQKKLLQISHVKQYCFWILQKWDLIFIILCFILCSSRSTSLSNNFINMLMFVAIILFNQNILILFNHIKFSKFFITLLYILIMVIDIYVLMKYQKNIAIYFVYILLFLASVTTLIIFKLKKYPQKEIKKSNLVNKSYNIFKDAIILNYIRKTKIVYILMLFLLISIFCGLLFWYEGWNKYISTISTIIVSIIATGLINNFVKIQPQVNQKYYQMYKQKYNIKIILLKEIFAFIVALAILFLNFEYLFVKIFSVAWIINIVATYLYVMLIFIITQILKNILKSNGAISFIIIFLISYISYIAAFANMTNYINTTIIVGIIILLKIIQLRLALSEGKKYAK